MGTVLLVAALLGLFGYVWSLQSRLAARQERLEAVESRLHDVQDTLDQLEQIQGRQKEALREAVELNAKQRQATRQVIQRIEVQPIPAGDETGKWVVQELRGMPW